MAFSWFWALCAVILHSAVICNAFPWTLWLFRVLGCTHGSRYLVAGLLVSSFFSLFFFRFLRIFLHFFFLFSRLFLSPYFFTCSSLTLLLRWFPVSLCRDHRLWLLFVTVFCLVVSLSLVCLATHCVLFLAGHNLKESTGPITVVSGKNRRITFQECPDDLCAMVDLAKVADLVLLVVDGR